MIKYIAGIILLLSLSKASAQNDSLMPNLSADYLVRCYTEPSWYYEQHILFANPNTAYDTVNVVYDQSDEIYAKLYMDTLKVWIKRIAHIPDCYVGWSEDEFTNEWELLYDFGLEVGDSAYSFQGSSGIITSIEEIVVQGQIRKKFIIDGGFHAYIQGVGDMSHPLIPKMYMFENGYETCTSQLYYSGPSPIDSITFSPNCSGEILSTSYIELENLNVYPNPATDFLHISSDKVNIMSGVIFNAVGKKVISFSIKNQVGKVDVGRLNPGIYFVIVQLEMGQVEVRKFVKIG